MNRKQQLFCFMVILLFVLGTTGNTFAANTDLIDQVKNEYTNYEKNAADAYRAYQQKTVKEYEQYRDRELGQLEKFTKQTSRDITILEQLLLEDFKRLEKQYGKDKAYSRKLSHYKTQINPNSLGSPMQKYAQSINPHSLNSEMYKFKNAVNENSLNSPMYKYKNAVNEHSLNSPMYKYKNAANEHSLNSQMYKLKNGSNDHSLNSVMYKYKRGYLTESEAVEQWNDLMKKEGENFQNAIYKTNNDIHQVKDTSDDSILTQKYKTVNGILNQRATSLQTIGDLRKEYFGKSVSFDPLIPDLGEINVIIRGEWLALKQSPVLSNGVPLVPIRPIFEKLDSAMKLNKKDDVITVSKPNVTITMTLNMNSATVNGKTVILKAAPKVINDQTMIPLQLISESLGNDIKWDAASKTIFIN
jgi:Copper amine oxidase N-terminal domain